MVHLVTDSIPAVPQKRAQEITGSLKPWKAASEKHCCVSMTPPMQRSTGSIQTAPPPPPPLRHSVKMFMHQESTDGEIRLHQVWVVRDDIIVFTSPLKQCLPPPQLILWLESTRKVLWKYFWTFRHLNNLPVGRVITLCVIPVGRGITLCQFSSSSPSLLNYFASIYSNQAAAQIFVHALVASGIDFCNSLLWPSLTGLFWGCNILWIQQVLQAWQHLIASLPAPFSDAQYPTWLLLWF